MIEKRFRIQSLTRVDHLQVNSALFHSFHTTGTTGSLLRLLNYDEVYLYVATKHCLTLQKNTVTTRESLRQLELAGRNGAGT